MYFLVLGYLVFCLGFLYSITFSILFILQHGDHAKTEYFDIISIVPCYKVYFSIV